MAVAKTGRMQGLCALRVNPPGREQKGQGPEQERKEQEKNIRKDQEATMSVASGHTQGSWDVVSEFAEDPNSSLEAPAIELEASSARHGICVRAHPAAPWEAWGG